jgi:hypothetical protein
MAQGSDRGPSEWAWLFGLDLAEKARLRAAMAAAPSVTVAAPDGRDYTVCRKGRIVMSNLEDLDPSTARIVQAVIALMDAPTGGAPDPEHDQALD